jgi:DAK2 domain fusion protein YloV
LQPEVIDGSLFLQVMASGVGCIRSYKDEINALNVFPVPDGDTGTNMFLTFQSALREMNKNPSAQIISLLESAAYGALMGARGNSGVIVSQFFRGFVKALPKDIKGISKPEMAKGLNGASSACFQAVRKPVEGTILTVIREIAKFAEDNVEKPLTLVDFIKEIYQYSEKVLAKTPEMLPVLKQAGVVDAGGQGLVYFLKGFVQFFEGEIPEIDKELDDNANKLVTINTYVDNDALPESEINFQYCTEFILKGRKLDLEGLKNSLNPHGDCLLVVGDENTAKIHIHTNNPGIILDLAVRLGDMSEIQINNMIEQSKQRLAKIVETETDTGNQKIGIIAVASGDGMDRILRSLGVEAIVNGGQTMNPSIEELTNAVSKLAAPEVIILTNNSNIVMTAGHVQDLTSKKVGVVPTHSIPEGLTALMSFSDEVSLDENVARMTEKFHSVITGEVTYAVRDVKLGDLDIKQDSIIGLVNGEIVTFGDSPESVVESSLQKIPNATSSLISIYYGADVTPTSAQNLLNRLEVKFPDAEIELYYGGQPIYYYLFSIE